MPRNDPRRQGKPGEARGRLFPRLLHLGGRPIKRWFRCTTRITPTGYLPILGIAGGSNYPVQPPYWAIRQTQGGI